MSNSDLLKNLYDAFAKGDMETVLGRFDTNISWREAEGFPYKLDGLAWHGPDAVVENLFMKLATEWEGFSVSPVRISEDPSAGRVVVEGRYAGKYNATGKSVDAQFVHIWDVADGKLTAFQQYTDTAQFQKVTGIS